MSPIFFVRSSSNPVTSARSVGLRKFARAMAHLTPSNRHFYAYLKFIPMRAVWPKQSQRLVTMSRRYCTSRSEFLLSSGIRDPEARRSTHRRRYITVARSGPSGRYHSPCFCNSARPTTMWCTSSGPSAKRKVRCLAYMSGSGVQPGAPRADAPGLRVPHRDTAHGHGSWSHNDIPTNGRFDPIVPGTGHGYALSRHTRQRIEARRDTCPDATSQFYRMMGLPRGTVQGIPYVREAVRNHIDNRLAPGTCFCIALLTLQNAMVCHLGTSGAWQLN